MTHASFELMRILGRSLPYNQEILLELRRAEFQSLLGEHYNSGKYRLAFIAKIEMYPSDIPEVPRQVLRENTVLCGSLDIVSYC